MADRSPYLGCKWEVPRGAVKTSVGDDGIAACRPFGRGRAFYDSAGEATETETRKTACDEAAAAGAGALKAAAAAVAAAAAAAACWGCCGRWGRCDAAGEKAAALLLLSAKVFVCGCGRGSDRSMLPLLCELRWLWRLLLLLCASWC